MLVVEVTLLNDDGTVDTRYSEGADVSEAVTAAEDLIREETGDDSWTMDSWKAA